ncbi:secreted protein containing Outer membrane protein, OmpA/MotB [Candidatus Magnetomorum sp. HK-1]|nr:secreted protein containing Outer membrane protein, OmpA/MotB [Candidatus Magnetomorum sp. HK-1]
MKYIFLPFLAIFLFIPQIIFSQDQQLPFPETRSEIIKALEFPKIRTRAIHVAAKPKVGAMIQFDYNSATIRPNAFVLLNMYVSVFQNELPSARIMIVGHTDNIGSEMYNQKLSLLRARAIKTYFEHKGIGSNRLSIRGLGESKPIASNADEPGRALNRRVEFIRLSDLF